MASSLLFLGALLAVMVLTPAASFEQSFHLPSGHGPPAWQQRDAGFLPVVGRDDSRAEPSKDTREDSEHRSGREIKQFTTPTIHLKGTAEEIGLDSRTLSSLVESRFLQEFTFLQDDFVFDKTYETWEIGLFECEVWTVGSNYPIALHIQCTGGSMDEPRHWHYATLGYGPKERMLGIVTKALDSILSDYATFVRKANGTGES